MNSQIKPNYTYLFLNHKTKPMAFIIYLKYSLPFIYLAVENTHLSNCENMHFTWNGQY